MQIQIPSEIFILRNIAQSCATSNHIHIHARPGAREKGSRRIASTLHTTQWQTQVLLNDNYKYISMTNTSAAQWQIQVLLIDKYKYCSMTNTSTAQRQIQELLLEKYKYCLMTNTRQVQKNAITNQSLWDHITEDFHLFIINRTHNKLLFRDAENKKVLYLCYHD